jgi:hypothetical protein
MAHIHKLRIQNSGEQILSTNYWSTPHAARGYCYLSLNAGAVRLLVPASAELELPDRSDVGHVSVQIIGAERVGLIHLVFEDGSTAPAYLSVDARQCDRVPPRSDLNRQTTLIAYGPCTIGRETVREIAQWPAVLEEARRQPR